MAVQSKVLRLYQPHRRAITRAMYAALLSSFGVRLYWNVFRKRPGPPPEPRNDAAGHAAGLHDEHRPRVAVNVAFLRQLVKLVHIAFPSWYSREVLLVALHALFLVLRTALSLYVARLDGRITAHLIKGEGRKFVLSILTWLAIGLPASATNAALQYLQRLVALSIRTRLTNYALEQYLPPQSQKPVYYTLQQESNLGPNVAQVMCADIARFAGGLSRLFSNLAKPMLDVTVYTWQLSKNIGADNVFFLGLAIQLSGRGLRLAAPPFGEYVAAEASLEGDFRAGHSRLIEYSEEIAFYDGHLPEKQSLDRSFYGLAVHVERVLRHRLAYNVLEDFVIKYLWGALGLALCSVPVFAGGDPATRAQNFVVNRRLLLLSSSAIGRIMTSYKDISSLAGYTARVSGFLDDITSLNEDGSQDVETKGVSVVDNYVEFDSVPVISPANDVLIESLSFRIDRGHHLLIVGPNGSGKSSLFRILGGLWPLRGGRLVRPAENEIFYIPQRPYLSRGSLRQQIIYPQSEEQNTATDEELREILDILDIGDIVEHVGGWDAVREWREDLSMGAQQRIAAARLFYHKPKFAILDECTSSVTLDTETTIYTHAKELGISLLTVSHRASLWQYHDKILQLDGQGHYLFADLNPAERLALEEEKLRLEYGLRRVDAMRERLAVLEAERHRTEDNRAISVAAQ